MSLLDQLLPGMDNSNVRSLDPALTAMANILEPSQSGMAGILSSGQSPAILEANRKLVIKLQAMAREAKKAKEAVAGKWDEHNDFYRGKQWGNAKRPNYRVDAVFNLVQQLVERKAALLTDANPIIRVTPTLVDNADETLRINATNTARGLEASITQLWSEHNLIQRIARLIVYAEIFGGGATNTARDSDRGPMGPDPTFYALDPRAVFFDPGIYCGEDLYKAQYMFVEDLKPTDWLRDRYPHATANIKASASLSRSEEFDGAGSFKNKVRQFFGYGTAESQLALDRTWVKEFWIADYSKSPEGKRLYPFGRRILFAEPDIIIEEGPNPYLDGQWPIDYIDWHMDLNAIWGFGDVELYKSPQVMLNRMTGLLIENGQLMCNSIWIGDANALTPEQWEQLNNAPGLKVKKRPGAELRRESPQPVSSSLFQLLQMIMGGLDKLSGISEVMEGRKPGSVESGMAIEALQSAAQTMVRYKARQVEALLNRIGPKFISRMFQFTTPDRIFSLTGDGAIMKSYAFEQAKFKSNPSLAFRDFKFQIIPGSSLTNSKFQKGMQAMQLFQMGIIKNPKRVLDAMEYPDRDDIVKENKEIEQQQMMMQMMMAQTQIANPNQPDGTQPNGQSTASSARGTDGGPGGRRNDQPPRPILRSPEVPNPTPPDSMGGKGPIM